MALRFPNPAVLTALSALALLAGCGKPTETTAPPPAGPQPDLFQQAAPAAPAAPAPVAPATPPVTAAPAPAAPAAETGPDWQKRFYAVAAEQQAKFSGAKAGDKVAIRMLSGSVLEGVIEALDESSVTLLRSNAQMRIPAANMAPESRGKLFAGDFGKLEARRIVGAERQDWLAANRAKEAAAEEAELAKLGPAGTAAARFPVPPVNGADGSVTAVKAYLKTNLRDPDSLRILKWGRVEKDPKEGWRVTCIYETLGGDFGKVTESKWFFINDTGAVFQTAAFKP